MKQLLLLFFLLASCAVSAQQAEKTPAFPGAEGFGRYTTGGRGGAVYHVKTLEDGTQEGTFRWACNKSGARTIVFDVSGTIYLKSQLKLSRGDVTIAGQTAPGDGICIADYPFVISADNVIIRYMRFRLGNRQVAYHEGDGLGGMDRKNIIVDHCSVSWSVDECLSVYGSKNITVQWCIAAHSMVNSGHSKGDHGYGGNWGGSGASYHHNLIAHHTSRTPRLGPRPGTQCDERMDFRNNVIYNWGSNGCYGGEGMNVNMVNNYYKPGPATPSGTKGKRIACVNIRTSEYTKHDTSTPNDWDKMWHVWGHYYVTGNVNTKYPEVTADNWGQGFINQIDANGNDGTFTAVTRDTIKLEKPIDFMCVTNHTAEKAYEKVLLYAGCSKSYDPYDKLILADTKNGNTKSTKTNLYNSKGSVLGSGFLNSQNDVIYLSDTDYDENHWPALQSEAAPVDSDGDGMPDEWERANGLNPNDATDGKTIGSDGYTNLENYLNSLVSDITAAQNADGEVLGMMEYVSAINTVCSDQPRRSNLLYNLQGQIVNEDYEGIVIKNGRKVIIK